MKISFQQLIFLLFYSLFLFADSSELNVSTNVRNAVNALTGHFFLHQVDAISPGFEPIPIMRSYVSDSEVGNEGGWKFFPHDRFTLTSGQDFAKEKVQYENCTAYISEPSGQTVRYTRVPSLSEYKHDVFTPDLTMSYDPRFQREISGKTDPKNNVLKIDTKRKHDSKAVLSLGNGGRRTYIKKAESEWFLLTEEVKPNGNILVYKHDEYDRLKSIISYNSSKENRYSEVKFTYNKDDPKTDRDFAITTKDKKVIQYRFEKPWHFEWLKGCFYLKEVNSNTVVPWEYGYDYGYKKESWGHQSKQYNASRPALINKMQSNGQSILGVSYYKPSTNHLGVWGIKTIEKATDYECGLVLGFSEIINANESAGYWFKYSATNTFSPGTTTVRDPLGNETEYEFGRFKKIKEIRFYDKDRVLERKEQFKWNSNELEFAAVQDPTWTGNNLELHAVIDPKGEGSFAYRYSYDTKGNIITKTLYGNLTGNCTVKLDIDNLKNGIEFYAIAYEYSNDTFNLLKKKIEQDGLTTHYEYVPGTDLLQAEYVCKGTEVLTRTFCSYQDGFLVERIVDDGSTMNRADETFRTLRKITKITPNANNYAEIIEEFGIDQKTGEQILIGAKKLKYFEAECHEIPIHSGRRSFGRTRPGVSNTNQGFTYCDSSRDHLVEKETVIDSEGKERYFISKTYDGAGHLTTETISFNGAKRTWGYNDRHFLKNRQQPESAEEAFTYYPSGAIHTHLQGVYTTIFTYDLLNHKKSETDPYDSLTEFTNDRFGNPVLIALEKSLQKNVYDFWGRSIQQTDPKDHITKTTFNARGQPIKIEHPTGEETFVYNLKGNLIEHIDLDKIKTVYEHDPFDRVCKKTIYSAEEDAIAEETKTYGAFLLANETDLQGYKTEHHYDHAGREIETIREGRSITYTFDPLGYLFTTAQGDLEIVTKRDCLGRVEEEEKKNKKGEVLERKKWTYDQRGLVKEEIRNFAGKEVFFKTDYDPYNRVKETTDPLGYKTTVDYSKTPHTKTTTDPLNRKKVETYNSKGKLAALERKDADGNTIALEEYEYDLNGNLEKQTSSVYYEGKILKKIVTKWDYGPGDRLKEWTEAFGTPIARKTTYEYTPKGLLEKVTKPDGETLQYSYDEFGYQKTLQNSDLSINYLYDYNHLGYLVSVTDLNTGLLTKRQLDPFGNIEKEELANGLALRKRYNPLDLCEWLILPDASLIEKKYDGIYLKEIIRRDLKDQPIYSHRFLEYDLSGNLQKEALPFTSGQVTYEIDSLGRFKAVNSPFFSQTIDLFDEVGKIKEMTVKGKKTLFDYDDLGQLCRENEETFGYDSEYNRRKHNGQEFEIDDLYQLKTTHQAEFTHDLLGNVETKTMPGGICTFGYDPLDRLVYFKSAEGVETFYTYDPLHRRLTKKSDGFTTRYLYDGQNEIGFEKDGKFSLRILGDTPFAEIGAAVALELGEQVYIPINDLQGSIAGLYDPVKQFLLDETTYTAFGFESSSSEKNPWRYLSKHADEESGLIYFGRRYYDPSIGRWITTDPKGYTDSMNLYAFALNDPFMLVDPYGLENTTGGMWSAYSMGFTHGGIDSVTGGMDFSAMMINVGAYSLGYDWSAMLPGELLKKQLNPVFNVNQWGFWNTTSYYIGYGTSAIGALCLSGGLSLSNIAPKGISGLSSKFGNLLGGRFTKFLSPSTKHTSSLRFPTSKYAARVSTNEVGQTMTKFLPFTKTYYRENLIRLTGINPGKKIHAHHVFSQEFEDMFLQKGINIHHPSNLAWWEGKAHQNAAKGYNAEWQSFFETNPGATKTQIFEEGKRIMSLYGMETNF